MSDLENLIRPCARLSAGEAIRMASRILTRAGMPEAALLLTDYDNWHTIMSHAEQEAESALPQEEPPTKLPKTWPFPSNAEEALI